jgi:hypothetical protein
MKIHRALCWIIPSGLLGFAIVHSVRDRYWFGVYRHYRAEGNLPCALARGYAQEFEAKNGRRPGIEELSVWGSERFAGDLERMDIGEDDKAHWKDTAFERQAEK